MQHDSNTDIVLDLIKKGRSVFITGKAGTGKTTLLRKIYEDQKRWSVIAIVAPTGVAAKNAGGITIHSLFHAPLNPYLPKTKINNLYSIRKKEDITLLQELDMIIIDEISMVRCDLMDAMDDILRHYRKNDKPFGGVQVVMFGDLYQLMPVAKDEDWEILKQHYKVPYFFNSDVYARLNCTVIELTHIYRQQDSDFINLLNHVRDGLLLPTDKKDLDSRLITNYVSPKNDKSIRLTTHNWRARSYNNKMLESLRGNEFEYKAFIEGYYPKFDFPTSYVLKLKVGARVMFVRNDSQGRFVNGTLGTIDKLGEKMIIVTTDEGKTIKVERQVWDFDKYVYDKVKKELEIKHCGSFTQFPLRLAWCVTIHKSQGLTFDKVVVDASSAFTYGQVYVALSRCRRFSGITLVSEIKENNVMIDPKVKDFLSNSNILSIKNNLTESQISKGANKLPSTVKRTLWLVNEGLNVDDIVRRSNETKEIVYSHLAVLVSSGLVEVSQLLSIEKIEAIKIAMEQVGKKASLKNLQNACLPVHVSCAEVRLVINEPVLPKATIPKKSDPIKPQKISDKHIIQGEKSQEQDAIRQNKRWTKGEVAKLANAYKLNLSYEKIAKLLKRTEGSICAKLQQLGYVEWDKETEQYIKK